MALLEFHCKSCKTKFEQITSSDDPERGKCPKCQSKDTERLISTFAIGGQGDLRETTMHGCHGCHNPGPGSAADSSDLGCAGGACDTGSSHDHSAGHTHDD